MDPARLLDGQPPVLIDEWQHVPESWDLVRRRVDRGAYAAASSTGTSWEKIRDAATSGHGEKPSKTATQPYRGVLERLWILDPVPAWAPTRNHIRRLTLPPKHQLADPALAARLLGVDARRPAACA